MGRNSILEQLRQQSIQRMRQERVDRLHRERKDRPILLEAEKKKAAGAAPPPAAGASGGGHTISPDVPPPPPPITKTDFSFTGETAYGEEPSDNWLHISGEWDEWQTITTQTKRGDGEETATSTIPEDEGILFSWADITEPIALTSTTCSIGKESKVISDSVSMSFLTVNGSEYFKLAELIMGTPFEAVSEIEIRDINQEMNATINIDDLKALDYLNVSSFEPDGGGLILHINHKNHPSLTGVEMTSVPIENVTVTANVWRGDDKRVNIDLTELILKGSLTFDLSTTGPVGGSPADFSLYITEFEEGSTMDLSGCEGGFVNATISAPESESG
jgi:hypothetical protein